MSMPGISSQLPVSESNLHGSLRQQFSDNVTTNGNNTAIRAIRMVYEVSGLNGSEPNQGQEMPNSIVPNGMLLPSGSNCSIQERLSEEVSKSSKELFNNLLRSIRGYSFPMPPPPAFSSSTYAASFSHTSFSCADNSRRTAQCVTAQMNSMSPMSMLYAVLVPVPIPYMLPPNFLPPPNVPPTNGNGYSTQATQVIRPNCSGRQPENNNDKRPGYAENDGFISREPVPQPSFHASPQKAACFRAPSQQAACFRSPPQAATCVKKDNSIAFSRLPPFERTAQKKEEKPKEPPARVTNPPLRRPEMTGVQNPSNGQRRRRYGQPRTTTTKHRSSNTPGDTKQNMVELTFYVKRKRDLDGKVLYTSDESSCDSSDESEDEVAVPKIQENTDNSEQFYVERLCNALEKSAQVDDWTRN